MKRQLESRFPKEEFLILNAHRLFELDFIVIDKKKEEVKEIHEVKTTVEEDPREFRAGSRRQLDVFELQRKRKESNVEFIPYFLDVVKIDRKAWFGGKKFKVSSVESYNIDSLKADLDGVKWILREGENKGSQQRSRGMGWKIMNQYAEICNLRDIGPVRAKKLISTGLNTIEKICETPIEQIVKAEIHPKIAWKVLLSAKALNDDVLFLIENFQCPKEPIYLDVETTPDHRFMTGTYYPKENEFKQFTVRNWNDANEKRRVEKSIYDYLKGRCKTIVTYTKYDLKFIPQKIRQSKAHYDLYYWIKRSFVLPTTDYKLSSVGGVFGYQWRNPELTGWDMPRLYEDFLESGDDKLLDLIKQHNEDDVMAMFHIVEKIKGQEFNRAKK